MYIHLFRFLGLHLLYHLGVFAFILGLVHSLHTYCVDLYHQSVSFSHINSPFTRN